MWRIALRSLLCLPGLLGAAVPAPADERSVWAALRQGGHVALMRHADGASHDEVLAYLAPTFSNAFVLAEQRNSLRAGARAIIADWKGPGTLLVVTHGANIQALTGHNPASGEIVVVAPDPGESLREVGRIPVPRR